MTKDKTYPPPLDLLRRRSDTPLLETCSKVSKMAQLQILEWALQLLESHNNPKEVTKEIKKRMNDLAR